MIDTDEQTAILKFVRAGKGDLIVEALAGTGKTTTIIKSLAVIPQQSILLAAFNKKIEIALSEKVKTANVPRTHVVHVKTFHAQGLAILKKRFPHLGIDKNATETLINQVSGAMAFKMRRVAVDLLRAVKDVAYAPDATANQIITIGHDRNLFVVGRDVMPDNQILTLAGVVRDAYVLGQDFAKMKAIDFCDMVWGPLVLDLPPPSRYQAVIVDEMQDISSPQLQMLKSLIVPGGRFIGIGDRNQAIYDWRGAVPELVWAEFKTRNATVLPLTISFRCSQAVVKDANRIVPSLRALPGAPVGASRTLSTPNEMLEPLRETTLNTFVLSRTNRDLLTMALFLWRHGIKFQLNAGEEMLQPLFDVLKNLQTLGTQAMFLASLTAWYDAESKRAEAANATAWAERLDEQYGMLSIASAYAAPNRIVDLLTDMIRLEGAYVLLSSVHRVKGLEADHVYLLKQTFAAHRPPRLFPSGDPMPKQPIPEEELCIEYVAITRAKTQLYWVNVTV